MKSGKNNILLNFSLFVVILLYSFLRLWNLPELTSFSSDQGEHLLQAYKMVEDRKITLIGPPIHSKNFDGRNFFIGPHYTYVLAIIGQLFKWQPLPITYFLFIFEVISVLLFFFWLTKRFNFPAALISFLFLTTNYLFVVHSRFIWNPHFLLPLGMATIFCLDRLVATKRLSYLFFASIIWGLAFSFHFVAILWFIPFIITLFVRRCFLKIGYFLLVPIGFFIGDLPYFVFEIRHGFYNLQTFIYVFTNIRNTSHLEAHYFIIPIISFILYLISFFIARFNKKLIILIISLLAMINIITFASWSESIPLGQPSYWNYPVIQSVANQITQNGCPQNYNIASTVDGDTRSMALRYLLTIKSCPPMAVDQYPDTKLLYLVAPANRPPELETVWEVESLRPFTIEYIKKINSDLNLYLIKALPKNL